VGPRRGEHPDAGYEVYWKMTNRLQNRGFTQVFAFAITVALLVACSGAGPESTSAQIPKTPVGHQLRWVIGQLNEASALSEDSVTAHFSPEFLQGFPAEALVQTLRQTSAQAGAVTLEGFSTPLDRTQAIALLKTEQSVQGSKRAAAYINVEPEEPHRITYLALSEPPTPQPETWQLPARTRERSTRERAGTSS
jgi:hypothetical protein